MVDHGVRGLLVISTGYSVLTAFLVGLRLAEQIGWPWLWIFSPLWLPTLLALIAFVSFVIVRISTLPRKPG
jgi:hypothetical protein